MFQYCTALRAAAGPGPGNGRTPDNWEMGIYGNLGGTGSFWGEVLVESDLGVGQIRAVQTGFGADD